jgi:FKBP-type peptidyl-prolyl cis-trans isomerase
VHYVGWLTDGTMVDSSHVHRTPARFAPQMVMPGFAEGLQLMQPGATFRLTIPPELAYGARRAGDRVPPNATLVFTVTLLGIEPRCSTDTGERTAPRQGESTPGVGSNG